MHPRRPLLLGALALAAALAGCVEAEERSRDFAYLHATIFEPSCATSNCHSAMTKQAGYDFSTVDVACMALLDSGYVVPGEPNADQTLIDLLRGNTMFAEPMPLDGPLPPAQIALIAQWIKEGASCE